MADSISYKHHTPSLPQLLELYNDAGWVAYTNDPEKLQVAFENSPAVISAWDGETLVGIIRAIGDKATILYIQDILVLTTYKRKGIGRALVEMLLAENTNIRQIVLLTDNTTETRPFYETLGFSSCDKGALVAFARVIG
jgi:GNAT superfamily N-acetyltransferase